MEKKESETENEEIQEMIKKCDNTLYSMSYISPNYPSNLIRMQKENSFEKESNILSQEGDQNSAIESLSRNSIMNILNAKAIKGNLYYLVELSNGEIILISNSLADTFISDEVMIDFLTNKIKNHKNSSIPILTKSDISNNKHVPLIQLPYFLSKEAQNEEISNEKSEANSEDTENDSNERIKNSKSKQKTSRASKKKQETQNVSSKKKGKNSK